MKFSVEVSGDLAGVYTLPKQITFAALRATNETAEHSQRETVLALKHDLVIRGNWINPKTRYGINVKFAKLTNLEAEVFTRADWLLEEEGYNSGVKTPDKGGAHLADPDVQNTRGGIRNKVKASQKARQLLQFASGRSSNLATRNLVGATGAFKIKSKSGAELILQRVGATKTGNIKRGKNGQPVRSRGKNGKVVLKYVLRKKVKVPQTRIIQKTVIVMTRRHFHEKYEVNIRKALRTARF
jgi:hypothetical protein